MYISKRTFQNDRKAKGLRYVRKTPRRAVWQRDEMS